ncbi:MAG: dTDP-4-dehydrorhamnose 3,5-epimerase family protein [Dysgonamonadaceae bacterium]|jgi:dTDP-4-dehydrorhamnose 3,5-epimerase|nr:dTDP-4-dehydrorhamnose 3,5-epimerase family protein [Dysgonamonadaceae bacterium]
MDKITMEGVTAYPLKRIAVDNGDILHAVKATDDGYAGFGEVYFSQIREGAVKGWKRHNRLTLNLVVPAGEIRFVLYDDRPGSATCGQFEAITLSPDKNYRRLTVAPGIWLAFQGIAPGVSMLMDLIPEAHDPEEADKKTLAEINYSFSL